MTLTRIWLIGISLLCLAGCSNNYGFTTKQKYQEPDEIKFSPEERGMIDLLAGVDSAEAQAFASTVPAEDLRIMAQYIKPAKSGLKKIMQQKNAWRAIVLKHNEQADEEFKKQMQTLGHKVRTAELEPVKLN